MGGMIAPLVAIQHPTRALTLTIVMSNLGGSDAVPADPAVVGLLLQPPADTREGLGRVRVPVLVVHGDEDPLVPFSNANRILAAAPVGAELQVMKGVGHEMPPREWPKIADGIARLAAKLEPGVGVAER